MRPPNKWGQSLLSEDCFGGAMGLAEKWTLTTLTFLRAILYGDAVPSGKNEAKMGGNKALINTLILTVFLAGCAAIDPLWNRYQQPNGTPTTYTDYHACAAQAEESSGYPYRHLLAYKSTFSLTDPLTIILDLLDGATLLPYWVAHSEAERLSMKNTFDFDYEKCMLGRGYVPK